MFKNIKSMHIRSGLIALGCFALFWGETPFAGLWFACAELFTYIKIEKL